MKILQVMAGGKSGGAETAFVDMCLALQEAGQDIHVVTRSNDNRLPRLREAGISFTTLPFRGMADLYTRFRLKKIIKDYEPDIVQTWMSRAAVKTPNWQSLKSAKRYHTVARLGGYYDLKYYKAMDYFIAVTPDLKKHIEDSGIDSQRVRQINNFAETENDIKPVLRKELDTPNSATVVVSLGRLHNNKALDILIPSIQELPNVYLWLAGDGPEKEKLEKQAKALGLESRVKFLGWRNDRAALLQAADICAFISRKEPFGTVFVQAWANKVPVIVSDAEGPSQYCIDGENCLMVPKEDYDAVTDAIKKLQKDSVLRLKLVNNGYQKYQEEFTKAKTVQAYLDYYQEIMNGTVSEDDMSSAPPPEMRQVGAAPPAE
jgi:glycosyltransferase involved in cell wall biosynthesis